MKYPKPWDAGETAGKPFVSSSTRHQGPRAGHIQIGTYVNRPGTPDHIRLIRTWLTLAEAERLRDELSRHIELLRHREAGIVEQMTNSGEIGTGPYHRERGHLASCLFEGSRWFCAGDCPHHVVVDMEATAK